MFKNEDWYEEIKEKMDGIDWDLINEKEQKKFIACQKRVANTDYCLWIETILRKLDEPYEDESWAYRTQKWKDNYVINEDDIKKETDLPYFHRFLDMVADIQRVKEYYDDRDGYPEYEYVWKFHDKYFEWNTIVGQGSITRIKQIAKPDFSYIDLDLYFKKEEEGCPQKK